MVNKEIDRLNLLKAIKEDQLTITELSERFKVNKMYLSGYLKALEDIGKLKAKKIGPSLVYSSRE